MEDARLEWIRDRVYNGLNLAEPEIFERFLEEDKNDDVVRKFFSSSSLDETAYAILFYLGTRFWPFYFQFLFGIVSSKELIGSAC